MGKSKKSSSELPQQNSSIKMLQQKRAALINRIENINEKVSNLHGEVDTNVLECRLQLLETYFEKLCFIQSQVEEADDSYQFDSTVTDFEELFIETKAKIMSLIKPKSQSTAFESTRLFNNTPSSTSHHIRLPALKLPKFDGRYAEYKRFIRSFCSMVDDDDNIPVLDKFNYLLSCLSGQALAVVEPFQVSEDNYQKVLDRLKDRYDNEVLIFLDHITSLFNISKIVKSDPAALRNIIDTVSALRGSLLSLGTETDILNSILIHIVLSKLDDDSKTSYNEKQNFDCFPSWDDCYKLLSRRCQFLESQGIKLSKPEEKSSNKKLTASSIRRGAHAFITASPSCLCCNSSDHFLQKCPDFLKLSVDQRFQYVKRTSLCINCLRNNHSVSKCTSRSRCKECNISHHTLLHMPSKNMQIVPSTVLDPVRSQQQQFLSSSPQTTTSHQPQFSPSSPQTGSSSSTVLVTRHINRAIIPTALVLMKDKFGLYQPVRALLDSCSEINFITEETAKRLQLQRFASNQEVSGISDIRTNIKYAVYGSIRSRITEFEWSSTFAIIPAISANQPGQQLDVKNWDIPPELQSELADPLFHKPQRIDILISCEIFFDLLRDGRVCLGAGSPSLQNTALGWIVGGKVQSLLNSQSLTCNMTVSHNEINLDSILTRFWEFDDYHKPLSNFSIEEQLCEQHFTDNVMTLPTGRIQVRLPFKHSPQNLGNSFDIAYRRFLTVERRLQRDSNLKDMYSQFMDEYISLGHMSPVATFDESKPHYIIPHHCVLRPQSTTTKLRVVFDASAQTTSSFSLNELLMVGPTIQQDLITTILSFRLQKYALTADISKMYRQFAIHKDDRKFQHILWRNNVNDRIQIYELNTVTYGMASSPFLAIRSLFHIAATYQTQYPIGSDVLKTDLYVDDLLTGSETIHDLQRKKQDIIEILSKAGLELAKWNSNSSDLCPSNADEISLNTAEDDITKALGMSWKPRPDTFCFRFDFHSPDVATKRTVMSIIARIFDMLGLLAPIVIRCKIILQELWLQNLSWDDPLPTHLNDLWQHSKTDLKNIQFIEVPRFVNTSSTELCEIHGFADASQRAYGCCIYVRSKHKDGFKVNLLIAKSKVAPIKAQSLPRLELCAAVVLNKTWQKIKYKLANYISSVTFWTDSKIVLQWLKMHSSTLNAFVANRVSELQEDTRDISWLHVASKNNPADIVSRGCSATDLPETIWFTGPSFLKTDYQDNQPSNLNIDEILLEKRKAVSFVCGNSGNEFNLIETIINKHSSYHKILRIFSYIFRIFNKVRCNKTQETMDIIHVPSEELKNTFLKLVAKIQQNSFREEIKNIQRNNALKPSLQKLTPFLDVMKINNCEYTLIRVGGRLSNANIPIEAKFPVLLPKEHRFTKLFVEFLHRKHLHANAKVLISLLQQKIWVVNARELVRKIVRQCVHCFHYKPRLMRQIMGNLPADRLRAQRPFLISGVDFCGPFYTSYRIRGKAPYKTYVAVFVCFASKATHIEIVSDLSTNNFLLCLKRFIGRRGLPQKLHCDNATNFVGAKSKLEQFRKLFFEQTTVNSIQSFASQAGFEFCFIPPRAPHFGGLWEAAVKSTKTLLVKNLTHAHLTLEELQTVVVEIEAILNSRPIGPLSNDPNEGEALTPGHMLIGSPLLAAPDEIITTNRTSNLNRWQHVSYLKQRFWEVWQREYIQTLQQKSKWLKPQGNIKVGQIVILHEDNLPPQQWILARVIQTISGKDNKVRVVEVRTTKGTFRRSIHKIAPLPLDEDF